MVIMALCTVLIAVCSWISIPAVVPFTLQTFAVFLTLELIGGKRGLVSIIIYILLAAVGAPVLAQFKGGIGAVLGMTGGYLLGFIFIALVYRLGGTLFSDRLPVRIVSMIIGLAVCYAFGTAWFMFVYARQAGDITVMKALSMCVIPFIIPDLIKLALAEVLALRLRKVIPV